MANTVGRRMFLGSLAAGASLSANPAFAAQSKTTQSRVEDAAQALLEAQPAQALPAGPDSLDLEFDQNMRSFKDFHESRWDWSFSYLPGARGLPAACQERAAEIFRANGIDPNKPTNLPLSRVIELIENDPVCSLYGLAWSKSNRFAALRRYQYVHNNADRFRAALNAADRKGPGVLDLSPSMQLPEYTTYEFHNTPGGNSGDDLLGFRFMGHDAKFGDAEFEGLARALPIPRDGQVRRILENATGQGRLVTALKRRFPDAEVWGIDVSAPLVRFAHLRANQLGSNVNFAQRLAEDNRFPDNYFDVVVSSSFFHETPQFATRQIYKEIHRVLRPGGVYKPNESGFGGYPQYSTPWGMVRAYINHRWQHETWLMQWASFDSVGEFEKLGFGVDPKGAPSGSLNGWGINHLVTKL
jgi:SAM-dependent methyltransferase